MGRRKSSRDHRRKRKKEIQRYQKRYWAVYYEGQKEWKKKLMLLATITPPEVQWPKTRKVSWETLPDLILQLDKDGLLPFNLKTREVDVWDPCYFNGEVKKTWEKVGISLRHCRENFWTVWPRKLTPRTVILTNPPFVQAWLEPFFKFLTTLDNPFLILLQDKAPDRLYFSRHLFDRVKRKNELKIYHLQKAYRMKQKGGKVVGFSGLTLCCYFPKQWRLEFDESKYSRVIPTYSLHSA